MEWQNLCGQKDGNIPYLASKHVPLIPVALALLYIVPLAAMHDTTLVWQSDKDISEVQTVCGCLHWSTERQALILG